MLAIAGAKGGCGKTTTTLGLAAAFARRGFETLAIDCDRQQPDLHVRAGVDSRPTVAAMGPDRSWRSVAQEMPETPGMSVVPGPGMDESVSLETELDRIDPGSTRVLLDCPTGVGPDVVEPLSMADGVVIVTTGTEQSLSDTRKTVDQARRLDVPILGTVLTHCDEVPTAYESRFDLPVLAVLSEYHSPLANDDARAAYANVVDELTDDGAVPAGRAPSDRGATPEPTADDAGEEGGDSGMAGTTASVDGPGTERSIDPAEASRDDGREDDATGPEDRSSHGATADATNPEAVAADGARTPETAVAAERSTGDASGWLRTDGLDTGIERFDRAVGGLRPGSVLVLEADAASQSELLLSRAMTTRGTLLVSTVRTETVVRDALAATPVDVGSPTVRTVPDGGVAEAERFIAEVPAESNVVVDAMAPLERADRESYADFLNALKEHLVETNGIAILHCLAGADVPANRTTTKHVADAVVRIESRADGGDVLSVPKLRSNGPYSERLQVQPREQRTEPTATSQ